MPFLAEEHIDIPATDLLSWMFDRQTYDDEKPVMVLLELVIVVADCPRFTLTLLNHHGRYLQTRPEV
jgi:hypothetical protein